MIKIYRRICLLYSLALGSLLTGCSFGYSMYDTQASYVPAPSPAEATVTFFRDPGLSMSISTFIAMQAPNNSLDLVGVLEPGQSVVRNLIPGTYLFVIGGDEGSQILKADLQANKSYFIQVESQSGGIIPELQFMPIPPHLLVGNSPIKQSIQNCVPVIPNQEGMDWFELNIQTLQNKLKHPSKVVLLPASYGIINP